MILQQQGQDTNNHIVFVGESGFPIGLATIQRLTLMAKAFLHVGDMTTVICRKGVWKKSEKVAYDTQGNFEGINYIYTSKSGFRPDGFLQRNIQKLKGMYGEYTYLKKLKKKDKIDLVIVSDMKVIHVLRYLLYSTLLNFPIAVNFVEMTSSLQHRSNFLKRVNDYLLDKWVIKFFDGALPISDKLLDYFKTIAPNKPYLKLPIICDFKKFNLQKNEKDPYFLYCGSFRHSEVRDFVVEAYRSIDINEHVKLYMIVSGGGEEETEQLQQEMNNLFDNNPITLFANIPYKQLVELYTNAIALLIPLRHTVQDAARFPHKIGEYLASGNPVITTDVGEIKNYFKDGKTALIADTYAVSAFGEKMNYVLQYPEEAKQIGLNGKELGLKEFDYKAHGERLKGFVAELKA